MAWRTVAISWVICRAGRWLIGHGRAHAVRVCAKGTRAFPIFTGCSRCEPWRKSRRRLRRRAFLRSAVVRRLVAPLTPSLRGTGMAKRGLLLDTHGQDSACEHAQMWALLTGLLDAEKTAACLAALKKGERAREGHDLHVQLRARCALSSRRGDGISSAARFLAHISGARIYFVAGIVAWAYPQRRACVRCASGVA